MGTSGTTAADLRALVAAGRLPAEAVKPRRAAPKRPRPTKPVAAAPGRRVVTRYEVVLPLPPTANNCYANVPGVGRVLTAAARRWQADAAALLAAAPAVRTPAQVTVTVAGGVGLPKRWDVDGRLKLCLDAVVRAGVLPDDDHQFVPRVVGEWDGRHPADGRASVRVSVETVGVEPGE